MESQDSLLSGAAALLVILLVRRRQRRRKRRGHQWVKPWIARRSELGAYHSLLKELQQSDLANYNKHFLRMDVSAFEDILRPG